MNNKHFHIKDAKIVVTGAAGFIGSHLTELLIAMGAKVTALVRYNSRSEVGWLSKLKNKPEIFFGNIEDSGQMNQLLSGQDAVFHLAALIGIPYSFSAPQSYVQTNINGTLNVLQAARANNLKRVILTSTSEVYGTAIKVPIDESHPLQAQSPYSASKIAADMLGFSFARSFNLPVTIVRPFNTFGPRQSLRAFIPAMTAQLIASKKVKTGDLSPVRDFNYVLDTAAGFVAAAERGKSNGEAYNLARNEGVSMQQTLDLIGEVLGIKPEQVTDPERIRPANSEVFTLIGSAEKARSELGWQPEFTFRQAVEQTVSWIKNHPELLTTSSKHHK